MDRIAAAAGDRLRQIQVPGAEHAVPLHLQQKGVLGLAVLAALAGASADAITAIIRGEAVRRPDAARGPRIA